MNDDLSGFVKNLRQKTDDLKNYQPIPNTEIPLITETQSKTVIIPAGDGTNAGSGATSISFDFEISTDKLFDFSFSVAIDGQYNPTTDAGANQMVNNWFMYATNPGTFWALSREINGNIATLTFRLSNIETSPKNATVIVQKTEKG